MMHKLGRWWKVRGFGCASPTALELQFLLCASSEIPVWL